MSEMVVVPYESLDQVGDIAVFLSDLGKSD